MLLSVTITRTGVSWMPKLSWTSVSRGKWTGRVECTQFHSGTYGSRCCAKNSMQILAAPSCLLPVNILFPSVWGNPVTPWTLSGGLKKSAAENFRKGLPETRQCGRTCPDQPHGHFASCRGARRRAPNGSSTTSESGRIWLRICFMLWRQPTSRLGPSRHGW